MIARTNNFKEEIAKLGRQIDFRIKLHTNDKLITQDNKFIVTQNNINLIVEQFNDQEIDEILDGNNIFNVIISNKGTILSTMMKEINFEINEDLRIGDLIDCEFGLKVNDEYEYINYSKYIIYSKELNEDTNTYSYVAYDSMLLSMVEVDDTSIIQNVTVKKAIENICDKVGLSVDITQNDLTNLPNLNKVINSNSFNNVKMTYRDVLDMICQCLGVSMISNNKNLYLKYFDPTIVDEFDENYLKDRNVTFGEKYGPINSVVLSRSEDNDNIYKKDNESIAINGLHEFKIKDNLIMLYDDREDYLDEIFDQLNGLEFYLNDFNSTGITYLEWLDFYNINRNGKIYKCLMLNDEIKIKNGLKEIIYTEKPLETTTDYTTSGKTDKEVSFIVDKQNGQIKASVKKGEIINEINLDESGASINAEKISLEGYTTINDGFSVDLDGNMTCNDATMNDSTMNNATMNNAIINGGNVELFDDGGESSVMIYDDSGIVHNVRALQVGDDLSGKILSLNFPNKFIGTATGTSIAFVPLIQFENGSIRYVNGYQYSNNVSIWLHTNDKNVELYYYDAEGDQVITNLSSIKLPSNIGKVTAIENSYVNTSNNKPLYSYATYDFITANNYTSVNSQGLTIKNDTIDTFYSGDGLHISNPNGSAYFNTEHGISWQMPYGSGYSDFSITKDALLYAPYGSQFYVYGGNNPNLNYTINGSTIIDANASRVIINNLNQSSLESKKKNFEKLKSGLDIIKDIDIYKYNLKTEEDKTKKHIGFVIGDEYKYSNEITNNENDGVDLYSFVAVCCKAIQEQQEEIESLKREIKSLKESDK